jgi:dTDP-L-rhamnose 4-epimerase
MKVLVTGGAGFIGHSLIAALPAAYEVVVVDSLVPEAHRGGADFPRALAQRAHCIRCDIADVAAWRDAAAGTQVVLHLAALTGTAQSAHQAERYRRANLTGTIRLCEGLASLARRPRRVILASSRAVYGEGPYLDPEHGDVVFPPARRAGDVGDGRWEPLLSPRRSLRPVAASETMPMRPTSVYASTKAAQERHCAAWASRHGVETIAMRLQNVYGPGQYGTNPHAGVVAALARGVLQDRRVELFEDGEMTRDFIHIDDVVRALHWAMECEQPLPHTANIGTGRRTSLRSLVEMLAVAAPMPPTVTCSGRFRAGDVRHACADTAHWRGRFGAWQPIALETGLPAYLDWLNDARAAACP